jgi:hypothetical protein
MRRDGFQEIERAEAVDREPVPQRVVAGGPDDPHVPARISLFGECPMWLAINDVEVHVLEEIVGIPGQLLRRDAGAQRFVAHRTALGWPG